MKKNSYIYFLFLAILYFFIDFVINFILIKLLGGYDNKINYDLSIIYSRLFITLIFIVAVIINRKISDYLNFKGISLRKSLLWLGGGIIYSFIIVFIKNQNVTEYNFHLTQNNYFLFSAIILAPFYEEIIKKGLLSEYLLRKNASPIFIIILISVLFSLSHLPSMEQVFYALSLGIITSWIYIKERNLIYPVVFHCVYNFIVLSI
ncbi:CPBP family intramembrane glutamic endopeptidase [Chryseobacterium hispalense]|uniref:CPBP family intramembrane glutamic endopeptidase n=1 Tax=Chryseobacterium hispalense TaxID=1453492 RepID=UPI00161FD464|nr:type II CAAX endopeptidase family protein [Chryseobacterium hispalense]